MQSPFPSHRRQGLDPNTAQVCNLPQEQHALLEVDIQELLLVFACWGKRGLDKGRMNLDRDRELLVRNPPSLMYVNCKPQFRRLGFALQCTGRGSESELLSSWVTVVVFK